MSVGTIIDKLQYQITRIALTRPVSELASVVLPPVDRLLFRITDGRVTILTLASDLLVVMLTTVGAKTGQRRNTPVVAVPHGSNLIVVASNHGKPRHPGWYYNLLANPLASVTQSHSTYEVQVHEAQGKERRDLWKHCLSVFPGWQTYDSRTTTRHLPIMVLRPTDIE